MLVKSFSSSGCVNEGLIITFAFNHLADAFIQRDLQMRRTIEARTTREQQYTSAITSSVGCNALL